MRLYAIFLTILLYSIVLLHLLALHFFWYWGIWWFDILMHFLGGFWLAGMAIWFFLRKNDSIHNNKGTFIPKQYFIAFLVVALFGGLWELFEFSMDTFIIFQRNDIGDTVSDLFMDGAGGLASMLSVHWFSRHRGRVVTDTQTKYE